MKSFNAKIGLVIVTVLGLLALFAPWLSSFNPNVHALDQALRAPDLVNWFGTDADGRDIFTRILYGARISLGISLAVTTISLFIGCIIGIAAGYFGGFFDRIFLFVSDVFLAFPSFLFAITIAAFFRPAIINIILILSLKGWVSYARLVRGQTLSLKEREFVQAGQALGVGTIRLCRKYLFPNMLGPVIVNASFGMAGVIIIESALAFLGVGVPIGTPSWGAMLDQGTDYLLVAPHLSIFPGIFIMLLVLGFNFLGDGLRDKWAPRGR